MNIEQHLRDELRRSVMEDWIEMENRMRRAWNAKPGTQEAVIALSDAFDFAQEMADEYDLGDEEEATAFERWTPA